MKRNQKITCYLSEEEVRKIKEASLLKALESSSFLRMSAIVESNKILNKEETQ